MKKSVLIGALALGTLLFSCEDDVNHYDKYVTYDRFVPSEYFNFRTSSEVTLNLNYGGAKMKMPIAVYTSDPLIALDGTDRDSLDVAKEPVFAGFTEDDGTLSMKIQVPAEYSTIYVVNKVIDRFSVNEVAITGVTATLDLSQNVTRATRATAGDFTIGVTGEAGSAANPYNLSDKLGKWNKYGLTEAIYIDEEYVNRDADLKNRMVSKLKEKGEFWQTSCNNSVYAKGSQYTNIVTQQPISKNEFTGKATGGTEITLHFLYENAGFHSTLGYYYYKKRADGQKLTAEEFKKIPKYVALPNCTWDEYIYAGSTKYYKQRIWDNGLPLQQGSAVRLKYFGESYDQEGSLLFPENIEVGWFVISDGFATQEYDHLGVHFPEGCINGYLETDNHRQRYSDGAKDISLNAQAHFTNDMMNKNNMPYIFSNEEFNIDSKNPGFVAFLDPVSGYIVMGCEDGDMKSFADVLFYIQASPNPIENDWEKYGLVLKSKASYDATVFTKRGAIAFEDGWPSKGDYDMNDVVIDYESQIFIDDNNYVKQIIDKFTPRINQASYTNAFGYELGIRQDYIESVTVDRGNLSANYFQTNTKGFETSDGVNSIVMLYNSQRDAVAQGTPITINTILKSDAKQKFGNMAYMPPYNPFIIAQANQNAGYGRKEVHLAKNFKPTPYAGALQTKDDKSSEGCWYVSNPDADGAQYPFAITIPYSEGYTSFEVPDEGEKISDFYEAFKDWSRSRGASNADWYKNPKSSKKK